MAETLRRWNAVPAALLALSAFMAPLLGGYVVLDAMPLDSGFAPFIRGLSDIQLPMLAHVLIGLPAIAALIIVLITRQVQPIVVARILVPLGLFLLLLTFSMAWSSFNYPSLTAWCEWAIYGTALVACTLALGRTTGPLWVLGGLASGTSIAAMLGILEYAARRSTDPGWRIFSVWQNPNALAAMLLVGLFATFAISGAATRVGRVAVGAAAFLQATALVLTQSKGGLLAGAVGCIAFGIGMVLTSGFRASLRSALPAIVGCALCLPLFVVMQQRPASAPGDAGGPGVLSRIGQAQTQQDQSAGFRTQLWKGAVKLIAHRPTGYGIGTYGFESAASGLTTSTRFTHNTYLQLAVEASPFAAIAFILFGWMWFVEMMRGAKRSQPETQTMRWGLVAAVMSVAVHSLIDSDAYYFGVGFSWFLMMGVGLVVAVDAISPEFVPPARRWVAVAGAAFVALLGLLLGMHDYSKARLRGAIVNRDVEAAVALADSVLGFPIGDGEAYYLSSATARSPEQRMERLLRAAALQPSPSMMRALARQQLEQGSFAEAITSLQSALARDPNSLPTLWLLTQAYDKLGDPAKGDAIARRLIAVEDGPVWKIRAIPELIPTETFKARIRLADRVTGTTEQRKLLSEAVQGFESFLKTTVPTIIMVAKTDPTADYGGLRPQSVMEDLVTAQQAARKLEALQRDVGDLAAADGTAGLVKAFGDSIDELSAALGRK